MSREQHDTAAMSVAWSERAKAALDLSRQYLASADAVIEQNAPVADPFFDEAAREVFKALTRVADVYEAYADRCRESARSCQQHVRRAEPAPGVYSPEQHDTFGGRSYDIPKCPHGCCPTAVCEFTPCDHGTYTAEQIADFYRGGAA